MGSSDSSSANWNPFRKPVSDVPRALLAVWTTLTPAEQPAARAAWRARQARLVAAGCHYWVFESVSQPGRFLEFTEAGDEGTLRSARREARIADRDDDVFHEVELS